jgi:hypothetical protein
MAPAGGETDAATLDEGSSLQVRSVTRQAIYRGRAAGGRSGYVIITLTRASDPSILSLRQQTLTGLSYCYIHSVSMARMNRRTWRRVRAVLIWAAIPVLIWVWTRPADPTLRVAVSVTYVVFFLLAAQVWCGAENRNGTYCRNNSTGLLVGCHLRQHRWQKLTSLTRARRARELAGRLFHDPQTGAAVVGAAAAVISGAAAWAQVLIS